MHVSTISQLILCTFLIAVSILLYRKLRVPILKKYPSKVNVMIDVRKRSNGELYLTLNGYTQGIETTRADVDKSYWYFIAKSIANHCESLENPHTMLLGLGAGTVPHLLNKLSPKTKMTIVEFDPVVIQACKDYFSLNTLQNFTLIEADALQLIPSTNAFKEKFDCILLDLFISKAPYVSPESQTYSFIDQVTHWGKPETLYIFNRPANDDFARKDQVKFMELIEKIFKESESTEIIDPRNYMNYVITGKTYQPLTT